MKAPLAIAAFAFCSAAFAEKDFFGLPDVPATAQLQTLSTKHKTDLAALDAQRDGAVARAAQPYLTALGTAENAALTASQLNVVAAITKERAAVRAGTMAAEFPAELPAALQPARKKCLETLAQISTDVAARRQKIDVEYVRSLNALQTSASPELSKAIDDEKLRFLAKATAPGPTATPGLPTQPPKPAGAFSGFTKSLREVVEGLPWAAEIPEKKFKPRDKAVPDELHVAINGLQIQIAGTKKTSTSTVEGDLIAHFGKMALIPVLGPQSGTIRARVPFEPDAARYGIALELRDEKLVTSLKYIKEEVSNDWSAKIEGGTFILEITKDGKQMNVLQAPAADVKAFGFCATVRYPGNKADLIITVTPSATIK